MPKLNEYLGNLVSSITEARVLADIKTMTVAEQYAKHPLLQHFPVAKMRIQDVEFTIPVALENFNEKVNASFGPIDQGRFHDITYQRIKEVLSPKGSLRLTESIANDISSEISKRIGFLDQELKIANTLKPLETFAGSLLEYAFKRSEELKPKALTRAVLQEMQNDIVKTLSSEIKTVTENKVIESLNVTVEADKLREKSPGSLIYIKMRISEEGMEWHRSENSKGDIEERLLPE